MELVVSTGPVVSIMVGAGPVVRMTVVVFRVAITGCTVSMIVSLCVVELAYTATGTSSIDEDTTVASAVSVSVLTSDFAVT